MLMVERRHPRELRAKSRNRHRKRKELGARATTERSRKLTDEERRYGEMLDELPPTPRPRTRGECRDMERPCPYVGCRHHLYLEVLPSGSIKFNHPGLELHQMRETCSLDAAEREPSSQEWTGVLLNLTHTRVEQIEIEALAKLRGRSNEPEQIGAALIRKPRE